MKTWFTRPPLPLGVDLGSQRVRIAVMTYDGDAVSVQRVLALERKNIPQQELSQRLRELLDEHNVVAHEAILTLQEPDAILRRVMLPGMTSRARDAFVRDEAYRLFGSERIVHHLLADQHQHDAYVLGLVRGVVLDAAVGVLTAAGMKVRAVDYAGCALARIFPEADSIVDIGESATRITMVKEKTCWGASVSCGGRHLTEALMQSYQLNFVDAERRKVQHNIDRSADAAIDMVAATIADGVQRIHRATGQPLRRVVVTGNGGRIPRLLHRLDEILDWCVEFTARIPIHSVNYPEDILRASVADWGLALGAALWTIPQSGVV